MEELKNASEKCLPRLAIDTREQSPLTFAHFPSERLTMATGDYGLADLPHLFCVERKSMPDLIRSLTTERERFERELERMCAFEFRRLLIIGTNKELFSLLSRRKVSLQSIAGSLRAIDATRVPVVRAETPEKAATMVEVWAWYAWKAAAKPFLGKLETPAFIKATPLLS